MSSISYKSVNQIRKGFLDFFTNKGHYINPSFPLVPINDNSLLLINAGMAPLKNYFTGKEVPPAKRMVTCQKCVRTNDIDNVGHTARHATFFEMLGNFSFGEYFKKEAIQWSWEYVTEVLKLDKKLLWVTVYQDDDEAYDIWKNIVGVLEERIVRLGKEDNFWEIGNGTGPCGPCSEIYIDRGEKYGCNHVHCQPGCDCDRFMEFWNLVFTQFNQTSEGEYLPLPNPNIDTGMGLERLACIMQGVDSIFDIDTNVKIKEAVCSKSNTLYGKNKNTDISIRIISDHIKAVTFLINDGVLPSNEGRGYILRRLLRRAARHGKLLGINGSFLQEICQTVFKEYEEVYTDLVKNKNYILKVIGIEEEKFAETIDQGLIILNDIINKNIALNQPILSGQEAFKLYDTFGFPLDLTREIVSEHQMKVDEEGFKIAMEQQKNQSRQAHQKKDTAGWHEDSLAKKLEGIETQFTGYDTIKQTGCIQKIFVDGLEINKATLGNNVVFALDFTPFYPEGGGQTSDHGIFQNKFGRIKVSKTWKNDRGVILHQGIVEEGEISAGAQGESLVETDLRYLTQRNHTATHLLHQALKKVLGDHVHQSGSNVDSQRLRFDFSHFEAVKEEELLKIETLVNQIIFENRPVSYEWMNLDEAKSQGATALFDEKYGSNVRVVTVEDFSKELCGGTHVSNTGDIGLFKILSEGGVASGVRRIEAATSKGAYNYLLDKDSTLKEIIKRLKSNETAVIQKIESLQDEMKTIKKELLALKQNSAAEQLKDIENHSFSIGDLTVITQKVNNLSDSEMRTLAESLVNKNSYSVLLLANTYPDKVSFVCMAGSDAVKIGAHAGNIIREVAKIAEGGGGGRPNMAQAGGKAPGKTQEALDTIKVILQKQLEK